jgi:L-seryl-tRNA(Ser) seleniumtransferase
MAERDALRQLPSVDEVLSRLTGLNGVFPRNLVVAEIRRTLEEIRAEIRAGRPAEFWVEARVERALSALRKNSLRRVINATGVVLHTNLGRAPLPSFTPLAGFSNLEYDLATGRRGRRDQHAGALLERLLGRTGLVVNNNAAAIFLVLNELASGGEVIVSRGELIEIGDGFRIPEIMTRSGAILREVGTTNRTRLDDYREAITDRTRLILRVHPSNFRIQGFTARPELKELVALGRERKIPVYEDLGSGCLADLSEYGIEEPLVVDSLHAGLDLVSFSGDKLLGGPQAGIIAGNRDLLMRLRRNPMFRALRVDKLIYQSLEVTLRHYLLERWEQIPVMRMISQPAGVIHKRAEELVRRVPKLPAEVIPGSSVIGGGATPEQSIPTWLIALNAENALDLERRLRQRHPPVITRIEENRVVLDLRTVAEEEEPELLVALESLV